MRFTQQVSTNVNVIRGYAPGELRINADVHHTALLVASSALHSLPALLSVDDLTLEHAAALRALEPELVLLGTGTRQLFPAAFFGAEFLRAGIGFEVMDTGAACRTFNVLTSEQRRVAALLMV